MAETEVKLSDEEKKILINFYQENPALGNSNDPHYKNKVQRSLINVKLVTLFAEKYTEDVLEKTFHSLRMSMLREVKKLDNGIIPKRNWKFFDEMEFLKGDLNTKKTVQFEIDEIERFIDFYRENAALWNHHLVEYRDKNLRLALLNKLLDEFKGKFTTADVKQQWHNLLTTYKQEKQRVDSSKSSGSGTLEVYSSNWDYFTSMLFIDMTSDIDESLSSLEPPNVPQIKKKKLSVKEDEQFLQLSYLKVTPQKLIVKATVTLNKVQQHWKIAFVFGRTVADSLLQCDTKDWPRLKKKIMDIVFEHEEQKSSSNSYYQTSPPCSNQQQQIFANLLRNIYTSSAHQQQSPLDMMPCTYQSLDCIAFSPGNTSTYSNDS